MYGSSTAAYDMGDTYNRWFSQRLGCEALLAYVGSNSRAVLGNLPPSSQQQPQEPQPQGSGSGPSLWNSLRTFLPSPSTAGPADDSLGIAFQDCAQLLLVTDASLSAASTRLPASEQPIDVTKFRPNIVVSGSAAAWAEDYWAEISIGNGHVVAALTANCARCRSIDVDYATGAFATGESGAVLKKLQTDRRIDAGTRYSPCFGRYGFFRGGDVGREVRVGDEVVVTRENEERTTFCRRLSASACGHADDLRLAGAFYCLSLSIRVDQTRRASFQKNFTACSQVEIGESNINQRNSYS
jgi:uncharacterized protein YcbX